MAVSYLEFHVEERSMEAFLDAWLDQVLPENCTSRIYTYQGKYALLRKLGNRLKGYSTWLPPDYRLVVIVDRDNDECHQLKSTLEDICEKAGLRSRCFAGCTDWQVVTRIAIEELEAWYFGDWPAVRAAYPSVSPHIANQARYRTPDAIRGGTWEAFERVMQKCGYFKQGLAKVQAATAIGKHIDPTSNRSHSFAMFRDAIVETIA